MKHLINFCLLFIPFLGISQTAIDRSKAPSPLHSKSINFKKVDTFILKNGLQVLVVQNNKLPVISAELLVDLLPIKEGNKTGLKELIFPEMLKAGTHTKTKAQLDQQIDATGGYVNSIGNFIQASALKRNFEKILSLMSDICLNPIFPIDELHKIKTIRISDIEAGKENLQTIANNAKKAIMFGKNHPYSEIATKATIENINQNDLKIFYNTYFRPNISYLVLVGDLNLIQAKKWAEKYFGAWKKKEVTFETFDFPKIPTSTSVAIIHRPEAVQTYIDIFHPIDLPINSSEVISSKVLNQIFGGSETSRLSLNLREKLGVTYGAYSDLQADRFVGRFSATAAVRNEKTDSAIGECLYEFKRIDTQFVTNIELLNSKNYLAGKFARSFEEPRQIATCALNIKRFDLPDDYYKNYLKRLLAVRAEDVRHSAQDYINAENMTILVVGNSVEFMPEISKYGNVHYYDELGNLIEPPVFDSSNIQPRYIFKKYLAAIAANKNLNLIKDLSFHGSINIGGSTADVSLRYIFPQQFINKIVLDGQIVIQQSIIHNEYTKISNHKKINIDEDEKQELKELSHVFSELDYLSPQNHFSFKVDGTEIIDNNLCYRVKFFNKTNLKMINCYDANTFLKVKSTTFESKSKSPQISYYQNYKIVNGIKLPTKIVYEISNGTKFEVLFDKIFIDSGLKIKDLK